MNATYNRELSWLAFNRRVLQEAEDSSVPLMQRLRFLGIHSSNNDEFIKVRLANLIRLAQSAKGKKTLLTGSYTPQELITLVDSDINATQKRVTGTYERLIAALAREGVHIIDEKSLNTEQKRFCHDYFNNVISRQVVPLFLHKTLQLPFLPDTGIYFAVCMEGKTNKHRYAILQTPVNNACPRFITLPSQAGQQNIIFLDDILRLCLDDIFFMFNYKRAQAYMFKLLRDASLYLESGPRKSLVEQMEKGLEERLHGRTVRLVYDREMPEDLVKTLVSKLKLKAGAAEPGRRYHMMRHLMAFPTIRPDLETAQSLPLPHPDIKANASIFHTLNHQDLLLSFPYQSFIHVIDFLREAAISPKVDSIHITLYRLASDSKIVTALTTAAKNGKKVTAYVELLARFDEERNVGIIDKLQEAGVNVIHSSPNIKIHSKLVLVQSKPDKVGTKSYVYIGTGNFNEDTAKIYSDFGLMTSEPSFVSDTQSIFTFLNNMHHRFTCKNLLVSPFSMRQAIKKMIAQEVKNAKKGEPAFIWIKCNNITDIEVTRLLYAASNNGVEIRLIVRSACIVKPQVAGLSDNITAISIVDTYLEHARMMIFCNGGKENVYISSADLMTRNLDRRVEVAAPIFDTKLKNDLKTFFSIQWSDTVKARNLASFGMNCYVLRTDEPPVRSQQALYNFYKSRISGARQ